MYPANARGSTKDHEEGLGMRLNGISERKKDQPKVDHLDGQLSANSCQS